MGSIFADHMSAVHKSFIREILKVTEDPEIISSPFQNITGLLFSNRLGSKPDRAIPRSTHSVVRISLLAF